MKKNLLGLILFCCMGLFVSCSDDDNASGVDAGQIHISAILPESITDGQAEIAGHKLRCILELWTKGEGAKLAYRNEVAVDPAAETNKLPMDLTVDAGTYDCLMWMDYVDAGSAATSRAEDGTSHYEDKYYDTSDLRNITVKDMNSLINNNACDAFFYSGEVQKKAGEAFIMEPELVRPFTKVSVLEKNLREFNLLKGLSVSYNAVAKFDVSTGKTVGETVTVAHSVAVFNPEVTPDGTLFSTYIFVDETSENMDEIHLSFTTKQGIQDVTIPSGLVPLLRNQHVKVSGNMMRESPIEDTEFDIIFDIDVAEWESDNVAITSRPIKAKVGDFFYADGTYSSSFTKSDANPCIGIVFAVAHDDGKASADKPENYIANNGTQKLQEVHGWVVAAQEVNQLLAPGETETWDVSQLPASELGTGKTDIKGFKNTEAFKKERLDLNNYPIAKAMIDYEQTNPAPAGTSGWYWGAAGQYITLAEAYAKVKAENKVVISWEYLAVGKSLKILVDNGVGVLFGGLNQAFYWSNSIEDSTGKIFRVAISTAAYNHGQSAGWNLNDKRHYRPILTF
ncbi:DUF6562 domain-containing protein [Bacteroides clarus]|nr:DUF6562 domain-containing protein [Bacteroides clarus]